MFTNAIYKVTSKDCIGLHGRGDMIKFVVLDLDGYSDCFIAYFPREESEGSCYCASFSFCEKTDETYNGLDVFVKSSQDFANLSEHFSESFEKIIQNNLKEKQ